MTHCDSQQLTIEQTKYTVICKQSEQKTGAQLTQAREVPALFIVSLENTKGNLTRCDLLDRKDHLIKKDCVDVLNQT